MCNNMILFDVCMFYFAAMIRCENLLKRGSMFFLTNVFFVLNLICIMGVCFFFIKTPMSERSVSLANLI